jgi:hypothetical protein
MDSTFVSKAWKVTSCITTSHTADASIDMSTSLEIITTHISPPTSLPCPTQHTHPLQMFVLLQHKQINFPPNPFLLFICKLYIVVKFTIIRKHPQPRPFDSSLPTYTKKYSFHFEPLLRTYRPLLCLLKSFHSSLCKII